jgi:hypothetical protein
LVWNVNATPDEGRSARLTNPLGALGTGGLAVVPEVEVDDVELAGREPRRGDFVEHAAAIPPAAAAAAPIRNVRRFIVAAGLARGGP